METEELWRVPHSWIWTTLKCIGQIVAGGTPSTKEAKYWGDDVNWISPADLTGYAGKTIAKGVKGLTLLGLSNSSAQVMPSGSVHFSSRAPIGYVAISSAPIATNQGFKSILPADGIFNEYVYYYLKASKQLAEKRASGTTFLELSGSSFASLPIPLAPTNEQRRIAAKIEELFSELDKSVESLKTAQEQLKVYRQAVLKHAFEGKLTEEWRNDKKHQLESGEALRRRVLESRKREWEKSEMHRLQRQSPLPGKDRWKERYSEPEPFDKDELPSLPHQWCWAGLDEFVSGRPRSIQSGPFGSNLKHSEFQQSGVLVIGIDNVRDGWFSMGKQNRISKKKFKELAKYEAQPGDLLVTVMASLGRTCVVPHDLETAIITKHVYRISMEEELLYPEYFNLLLQSPTVSRLRMFKNAQGQTRPGLNSAILRALPIPLCSRQEQVGIVSQLKSPLSKIERMISEIDEQIAKSVGLRQSILKRAFSGQLVVQDPNDEPASMLLKRIKAEKKDLGEGRRKKNNQMETA